jgi:hypothetical protein
MIRSGVGINEGFKTWAIIAGSFLTMNRPEKRSKDYNKN